MDEEKKVMLQEIAMQPDFVRDNVDSMLEATRAALAAHPQRAIGQGFMIGCGDSYCAALAARSFVMDATGRMVEPVEALEFSRYLVGYMPADSFVFGVSNSGTVSRTIEGVALARERGAWTFAVTVSADNRLAATAETLVKVNAVPNIKERPDGTRVVTPGSVTYTASMLGLFVAGIALGEKVGNLDPKRSAALVGQLHGLPDSMAAADKSCSARRRGDRGELLSRPQDGHPRRRAELRHGLFRHGEMARGADPAVPHLGARGMGARGILRHRRQHRHDRAPAARRGAEPRPRAGGGGARDGFARHHHRRRRTTTRRRRAADVYFGMPPEVPEPLTPFVYKLPFEYLSCQIAHEQKIPFLGFHNPKRQQVNFRQIFNSAQSAKAR